LGIWTLTKALTAYGNLTIEHGELNANGKNITVGGDWTNYGAFTHGNNTITLDGTNQSISGDNTFYNIKKTNAGTLTFSGGATQTIEGMATFNGSGSSNLLTLNKDGTGTYWNIDIKSDNYNFQFLDVYNSNNLGAMIYSPNSLVTNCIGWAGTARPIPEPKDPGHATYENEAAFNIINNEIKHIGFIREGTQNWINLNLLGWVRDLRGAITPHSIDNAKLIMNGSSLYIAY
jgi:uncharacterized glyoxalase superfamily protein PhnB